MRKTTSLEEPILNTFFVAAKTKWVRVGLSFYFIQTTYPPTKINPVWENKDIGMLGLALLISCMFVFGTLALCNLYIFIFLGPILVGRCAVPALSF